MPFPPGNGVQFCQHSRRNPPVQGELNEDPQVCHFFRTLCFRLPLATSLPGEGGGGGPPVFELLPVPGVVPSGAGQTVNSFANEQNGPKSFEEVISSLL